HFITAAMPNQHKYTPSFLPLYCCNAKLLFPDGICDVDRVRRHSVSGRADSAPARSAKHRSIGNRGRSRFRRSPRWFTAYDDATGKTLWRTRLTDVPNSAPITYMANGKQYVATCGLIWRPTGRKFPAAYSRDSASSGCPELIDLGL